jgi:4-hydroxybenzoate polyprenyltransferase
MTIRVRDDDWSQPHETDRKGTTWNLVFLIGGLLAAVLVPNAAFRGLGWIGVAYGAINMAICHRAWRQARRATEPEGARAYIWQRNAQGVLLLAVMAATVATTVLLGRNGYFDGPVLP